MHQAAAGRSADSAVRLDNPSTGAAASPELGTASIGRLTSQPASARTWADAVRTRQWVKNLLVFAAPAAADALSHGPIFGRTAAAFLAFCLLSSAVYLLNDVADAEEDRRHPVKRQRPIAAGLIGPTEAIVAAAGCLVVALVSSALVDTRLLAIAIAYAALNFAYTGWLRRIAVLDLAAVAGCFVLRAAAGGAASGIGLSNWFVIVISLAAVLVAAGKRYGDLVSRDARGSRAVLRQYSADSLNLIVRLAGGGAILAYVLWAFTAGHADFAVLRALSVIPFGMAILRYTGLVRMGRGGTPEAAFFHDRFLQGAGLIWLVLFAAGA